jgi:hypothetical protein
MRDEGIKYPVNTMRELQRCSTIVICLIPNLSVFQSLNFGAILEALEGYPFSIHFELTSAIVKIYSYCMPMRLY